MTRVLRALLPICLLGATACAELDAWLADVPPPDPSKTLFRGQVKAPFTLLGQPTATESGHALQEAPVSNASIRLADGAGNAIPGLTASATDASGMYQLPGVPRGHAYVVTADFKSQDGKDVRLKALARALSDETTVNLTTHTTLVTETVTRAWPGLVISFNPDTFKRATEVIAANLTNDTVPNLSDRNGMVFRVQEWTQTNPALANSLQLLRDELVKGQPTPVAVADLTPSPAVTPSASASPSPTPSVSPSSPPSGAQNSATIAIENNQFNPTSVTIRKGGTIRWLNRDNGDHTATPTGTLKFSALGAISPGVTSIPIRFEQVGEYPYECSDHPHMKGMVIVVP